MTQSHHFHQHVQANGVWWPPRPLGSNILRAGETTGRWYYYDGQQTRQVNAPATSTVTPYKTYSFYFDHQLIWVYTGDATIEQVGDGSGNPRVPRPGDYDDEDDEEDDEDGQGDNSSDEPDDPDENTSDWKIMHFDWPADNTYTSSVTARGEHPNLRLQGRDQPWVEQLIPERYFAAPNYRVLAARPHNFGGMTGELPIMIALIAFSVRSNQVHAALTHCIRQAYNPHDIGQRGDGCKLLIGRFLSHQC